MESVRNCSVLWPKLSLKIQSLIWAVLLVWMMLFSLHLVSSLSCSVVNSAEGTADHHRPLWNKVGLQGASMAACKRSSIFPILNCCKPLEIPFFSALKPTLPANAHTHTHFGGLGSMVISQLGSLHNNANHCIYWVRYCGKCGQQTEVTWKILKQAFCS